VTEPFLKLTWSEAGRRNVFLGKFGEESSARNRFVTLAELCGSNQRAF
jgi:hypothetical protein